MQKLIVIVGPTGSGKSVLGVLLARQCNGEIISGDSRQVYRGCDIGTGKIRAEDMHDITHHCLSFVDPKKQCSLAVWRDCAQHAVRDIASRGKLPFVVGGTAFYIYGLIDAIAVPSVPPNPKLRRELERRSIAELFVMLEGLDPHRAEHIERGNRRRLIRAIEIVRESGSMVPRPRNTTTLPYDALILGIWKEGDEIREAIERQQRERLQAGVLNEIAMLRRGGMTYKRIRELGLDYRYLADVAAKRCDYHEAAPKLCSALWRFTKQQMNWWKRDPRVVWVRGYEDAAGHVERFVNV